MKHMEECGNNKMLGNKPNKKIRKSLINGKTWKQTTEHIETIKQFRTYRGITETLKKVQTNDMWKGVEIKAFQT